MPKVGVGIMCAHSWGSNLGLFPLFGAIGARSVRSSSTMDTIAGAGRKAERGAGKFGVVALVHTFHVS